MRRGAAAREFYRAVVLTVRSAQDEDSSAERALAVNIRVAPKEDNPATVKFICPVALVPTWMKAKKDCSHELLKTQMQAPLSKHVACVDYSAGKGGPLCAYRWNGDRHLDASCYRCV